MTDVPEQDRRQHQRRAVDRGDPEVVQEIILANEIMAEMNAKLDAEKGQRDAAIAEAQRIENDKRIKRRNLGFVIGALAGLCLIFPTALFIYVHGNAIDRIQATRTASREQACKDTAQNELDANAMKNSVANILNNFLAVTQTEEAKKFLQEQLAALPATKQIRNCTSQGIADYYSVPQGPNAYLQGG